MEPLFLQNFDAALLEFEHIFTLRHCSRWWWSPIAARQSTLSSYLYQRHKYVTMEQFLLINWPNWYVINIYKIKWIVTIFQLFLSEKFAYINLLNMATVNDYCIDYHWLLWLWLLSKTRIQPGLKLRTNPLINYSTNSKYNKWLTPVQYNWKSSTILKQTNKFPK